MDQPRGLSTRPECREQFEPWLAPSESQNLVRRSNPSDSVRLLWGLGYPKIPIWCFARVALNVIAVHTFNTPRSSHPLRAGKDVIQKTCVFRAAVFHTTEDSQIRSVPNMGVCCCVCELCGFNTAKRRQRGNAWTEPSQDFRCHNRECENNGRECYKNLPKETWSRPRHRSALDS